MRARWAVRVLLARPPTSNATVVAIHEEAALRRQATFRRLESGALILLDNAVGRVASQDQRAQESQRAKTGRASSGEFRMGVSHLGHLVPFRQIRRRGPKPECCARDVDRR